MLAMIIILLVIAFLALGALIGGAIWMTRIIRARRLYDRQLQAVHEAKLKANSSLPVK